MKYGEGNGTPVLLQWHSSTLAWRIPWTQEPGRLRSMGSLRVGHDRATSLSLFTFMHWRRKWQPTPVFLPGESQDRGAWWAAVYRVAQSQTQLKRLSSSSSSRVSIKCDGLYFDSRGLFADCVLLPSTPHHLSRIHSVVLFVFFFLMSYQ